MDKEKIIRITINILKKTLKWLLILLAIVCCVLILLAVYLLVLDFFYEEETMSALINKNYLLMSICSYEIESAKCFRTF